MPLPDLFLNVWNRKERREAFSGEGAGGRREEVPGVVRGGFKEGKGKGKKS